MSIPVQRPPLGPQESQVMTELQSEVSVEAAPLLQFILKHAALIMTALGLFALLLAGTASYRWYSARATTQAQTELARLTMISDAPQRFAALEQFVGKAPEQVRLAALLELANAALVIKNYDKAAEAFGMLAKSDANNPLGYVGAFNEAQTLLHSGKSEAALTVLEKLENEIPEDNRLLVRSLLAEAAIAAGKPERAISAYDALAAAATGPEADFFRFRAQTLKAAQAKAQ